MKTFEHGDKKRLTKDISKEMDQRIQKSIKLVQKKYKVDVLGCV
ncbi:spore gernimation protein LC [Bacillus cereus]|nr:spore gernimation protein LC [Bacillus cereus]PGP95504.1 spore gernimation protein LC [Bacillus cereus]